MHVLTECNVVSKHMYGPFKAFQNTNWVKRNVIYHIVRITLFVNTLHVYNVYMNLVCMLSTDPNENEKNNNL